jgi:hypothetical protein
MNIISNTTFLVSVVFIFNSLAHFRLEMQQNFYFNVTYLHI